MLPFALAMSADLFIAGDLVLGRTGGIVAAAIAAIAASLLWYGLFARRARRSDKELEDQVKETPLERIVQVLTEARVVLPGAQALLGFQLAMVLMDSFEQRRAYAKIVHLSSIGAMALATMVLMGPAAYHRIVREPTIPSGSTDSPAAWCLPRSRSSRSRSPGTSTSPC